MKSQQQIICDLVGVGSIKVAYTPVEKFVRTVMAGAFIALGGILSIVASAGFADNPSAQKVISGLTFPIGLLLTVVFGAELFTGNCAVLMPGLSKADCLSVRSLRILPWYGLEILWGLC